MNKIRLIILDWLPIIIVCAVTAVAASFIPPASSPAVDANSTTQSR